MRQYLLFFLKVVLACFISGSCLALDYDIISLIEIKGSSDTSSILYSKWSRDGSRLLGIENGQSMIIYDTTGSVLQTIKPQKRVRAADWLSGNQICIDSYDLLQSPRRTRFRLSIFDLQTGLEEVINEFDMGVGGKITDNNKSTTGIFETLEGGRYYLLKTYNVDGTLADMKQKPFIKGDSNSIMDDHFLRWGVDGLYIVKFDQTDSNRLVNLHFTKIIKQPDISTDRKFATDCGFVFNLLDSTEISLNSMLGPPPESTYYCTIGRSVFNPTANELAFAIGCEGEFNEREILKSRMGTYDCLTNEMKILDSILGLTNCYMPEFSPDGRRISFISGRKSYILARRFF